VIRSAEQVERARGLGGEMAELIDRLDAELESMLQLPIAIREGSSPTAFEIVRRGSARRRPFDVIASLQFEGGARVWMTWHDGMPTQGTLVEELAAIDDWGYASSRNLKSNRGTWLPVESVVRDFESFRAMISASVAMPESLASVPPRLRAEVLARCSECEPGFAALHAALAEEERSRGRLLEEAAAAGADARKAMLLLINNITYQQIRNHRELPIRVAGSGNDRVLSRRVEWSAPSSSESRSA
jgi:hypothetical protein